MIQNRSTLRLLVDKIQIQNRVFREKSLEYGTFFDRERAAESFRLLLHLAAIVELSPRLFGALSALRLEYPCLMVIIPVSP